MKVLRQVIVSRRFSLMLRSVPSPSEAYIAIPWRKSPKKSARKYDKPGRINKVTLKHFSINRLLTRALDSKVRGPILFSLNAKNLLPKASESQYPADVSLSAGFWCIIVCFADT